MALDTPERYSYVKNILLTRMSYINRPKFYLQRLHTAICGQTSNEAYFDFTYDEFYDMFIKECIGTKSSLITGRKFEIADQGFLDKKKNFPYAKVSVEKLVKRVSKKNREMLKQSIEN